MSTLYTLTRDQLCTAAIKKLGVIAKGQSPDTSDLDEAALNLNLVLGNLRTKGLFLWKRVEYEYSLTAGTSLYNIGVGQTLNTPYPLKMLSAYSTDLNKNQVIPIDIIGENEYNILPANASSGMPLKLTYQPKLQMGVVRVWPKPDASVVSNYRVTLVYQAPFEFPEESTDTLDIPEEWYLPIVYHLALVLAPEWGIPLEDRRQLINEAKQYIEDADNFGTEDASLFIKPR